MSRTAVYSALVLRNRPSGESNSEVTLLTAEEGIIKATVFGGPKSKLRAHSAPYNSGQVWVYRDPAKDYGKLSDFDVRSWRPGLRELYERTMAASALAETVLHTHGGGGGWEEALKLATAVLDALESANEELCPRLLVHFLWRWAGFLGIQPHIESCAVCGDRAVSNPLWFSAREGSVLCGSCVPKTELCPQERALSPKSSSVPQNQALSPKMSSKELSSVPAVPGLLLLNPGSRRWLTAVEPLEPALLYRYSMDNRSFHEAKSLACAVLTAALGKKLASWEW
jgi:DNA repair protein RecO (recombination protein O)